MKSINETLSGLTLALLLATTGTGFCQTSGNDVFTGINLTATPVKAKVLSLIGTDISEISSLSDAQLTALMSALDATPTIPARLLPHKGMVGAFWSLQNPKMPPLPGNTSGSAVWPLSDGSFLLNDVNFNYGAVSPVSTATGTSMGAMADSSPPAPGSGGGSGTNSLPNSGVTIDTNRVWLQIIAVTNKTASLVIHPPWNVTNQMYDLLYTTNLASPNSWRWLMRSDPGQTNLLVPNAADAQGFYRLGPPNDLTANDSLGTNFWMAFFNMPNYYGLSLFISSPVGASGTVTIPGLGFTNSFSIASGMITNISIPYNAMMGRYDDVETNGIHITASQPISVYALNYDEVDTAAFTCYPTPLLGTNYCVMAYAGYSKYGYAPSQFAIIATADTVVTITPSTSRELAGHVNSYTETLRQGQTYEINDNYNGGDVTGTRITSDKPIGVFAGAYEADVPVDYDAANPLVQEQLPVDQWGTQALVLSFAGKTWGDTCRVLAATNDTVVLTNGVVAGTNQAGQYIELIINGPVEFQGNHPIQVAHFSNGIQFGNYGDPCEILVPPTGHYLKTNIVYTLTDDNVTGDFYYNYLSLIVAQSAITNTLVDGLPIAVNNFVEIGSSGYFGAYFTVTNSGLHTVTSSQPVGVEVYGFGFADAYGYFGGIVK